MKKHFISYGDAKFAAARDRIAREARETGEFDTIRIFTPDDVTEGAKSSRLFNQRRGGGYWIWKPDVILTTLQSVDDGDIVVYCDCGCELVPGREWKRYWQRLENHEIVIQRIYQVCRNWTRHSIQETFFDTPVAWLDKTQVAATVVMVRKTPFVMYFIDQWQKLMILRPDMVGDVTEKERPNESPDFIENRHDQAILSALAYHYKYLPEYANVLDTPWEHFENLSLFRSQVIRAMRNTNGTPVSFSRRCKERILRLAKDILRKPYFVLRHG